MDSVRRFRTVHHGIELSWPSSGVRRPARRRRGCPAMDSKTNPSF